jgi:hypothetical protein
MQVNCVKIKNYFNSDGSFFKSHQRLMIYFVEYD